MNKGFAKIGIAIAILLVIAGGVFVGNESEQEVPSEQQVSKQSTSTREQDLPADSQKETDEKQVEQSTTTQKQLQTEDQDSQETENPKQVQFQWNYHNKQYELTMTLYESLNEYYNNQPKKYSYTGQRPENWEEEYYSMFLEVLERDNTFSELASELKAVGERNNLSNDEVLELTVAFVQSIPYDQAKSERDSFLARYPYEVLYDRKGVCSGKSFLGALLVKELDYGVALFSYDRAEHMVIGIKCPEQYDSYDSGYCFTELTTPGWKIGVENFKDVKDISSTTKTPPLNQIPEVYRVAEGKTYQGVDETMQEKQEIKTLRQEIEQLADKISKVKEDLEYYKKVEDYDSYNELVSTYNDLVSEHTEQVETYNNLIEEFSPEE